MILNVFEEKPIRNADLPVEWQSQTALDELADFLQRNWEQRFAFYDDKQISSRQQFLSFIGQKGVKPNNYIGTIVFKGQRLNIFPKMFQSFRDENDKSNLDEKHLLKNIVQWVEYCTKIDYPYINITSELDDAEDLKELFITLYVRYVKSALDRGLFYQYEDRTEDCSTIKGKVDYRDYFTNKYRTDKQHLFQCTFSTFEFDNSLNRIIKFVCKKLLNDTTNTANKKMLRHILMKLNEVSDVRCAPHDCDSVRLTRFHQRYRIVLSMSKMFLLNQTSTYAVDDTEAFCFLFPTEVLFEGFVGGFLQSILQEKANVTLQASDTSLIEDIIINDTSYGSAFTLRNDIYVQMEHGKCFVLDTKYKQVDRIENSKESAAAIQRQVSIDDLRQIREYAHRRGLKEGYLLYPVYRFEDLEQPPKVLLKGYIIVDGERHYIDVYIIRIPFVFEEDTEQTKLLLSKMLSNIFYE